MHEIFYQIELREEFRKNLGRIWQAGEIWHRVPSKLWRAGITGNLWKCFLAYLTQWKQCVTISGRIFQFLPVLSGVPQGSIPGPLLFLIYINDLPLCTFHSMVLLFADDTKSLKQINSSVESLHLQCDLNALHACSKDWKLPSMNPRQYLFNLINKIFIHN